MVNRTFAVQHAKGKTQPVFCAGDARAEDRGHYYQGAGALP